MTIEEKGLQIPYETLSSKALEGIIMDFILREGTDYGHQDISIDSKKEKVLMQLQSGKAHILYDQLTETCSIVPA